MPKAQALFGPGHVIQMYFVLAGMVPLLPRGEAVITPRCRTAQDAEAV